MDEARLAARLQSPGLVRVLGIGRVEQSVYVSTELVEGRSVEAILERCRGEAFPFAADHALMIASRAAVAFEFLHGKRNDAGGLPLPRPGRAFAARRRVRRGSEGEGPGPVAGPARHGSPPRRGAALPGARTAQRRGGGSPLRRLRSRPGPARGAHGQGTRRSGPARRPRGRAHHGHDRRRGPAAEAARGTAAPRPWPRARRALLRHGRLSQGDRRAALLGGLAPTTFDLAFFMHTLFREDMEREARALEDARRGDYGEFIAGEKQAAPAPAATDPDSGPALRSPTTSPAGKRSPREGDHRGPGPDAGREPAAHRVRPAVSRRGARSGRLGLAPGRASGLARGRGTRGGVADDPGGAREGTRQSARPVARPRSPGRRDRRRGGGLALLREAPRAGPPGPGHARRLGLGRPGAGARARGEDRSARAREGRRRVPGGGGGAPDRRGPGRDRGKDSRPQGGGAGAGGGAAACAGRTGGPAAGRAAPHRGREGSRGAARRGRALARAHPVSRGHADGRRPRSPPRRPRPRSRPRVRRLPRRRRCLRRLLQAGPPRRLRGRPPGATSPSRATRP